MYGMLNIILKMVGMTKTLLMIEFMVWKILCAEAKNWPIERVADVTGVKADLIVQITKLLCSIKTRELWYGLWD